MRRYFFQTIKKSVKRGRNPANHSSTIVLSFDVFDVFIQGNPILDGTDTIKSNSAREDGFGLLSRSAVRTVFGLLFLKKQFSKAIFKSNFLKKGLILYKVFVFCLAFFLRNKKGD